MYYPQVPVADRAGLLSDTAGFDELVAQGVKAARERRQKIKEGSFHRRLFSIFRGR